MGFGNKGRYLVWRVDGLSVQQVKSLFNKGILTAHPPTPSSTSLLCRLDVDVSWVAQKICIGKSEEDVICGVCDFLRSLAYSGFVVTPILDGKVRHHSKQATISRISIRERKKVSGIIARFKGISLEAEIESLKEKGLVETKDILKRKNDLASECKKSEQVESFVKIGQDFCQKLQRELDLKEASVENENGGVVLSALQATFQADSLISCRKMNGKTDLILSSDIDFCALVGPNNVQITDFTFQKNRTKAAKGKVEFMVVSKIQLKGSSNKMYEKVKVALNLKDNIVNDGLKCPTTAKINNERKPLQSKNLSAQSTCNNGIPSCNRNNRNKPSQSKRNAKKGSTKAIKKLKKPFEPAQYSLFDNENFLFRSIVAVVIGCDVLVGGWKGNSVSTIFDLIETKRKSNDVLVDISGNNDNLGEDEVLNRKLIEYFSTEMKMTEDEFLTYCMAFMNEPGIEDNGNENGRSPKHYMTGQVPLRLPRYLEDFKGENTEIYDGPTLVMCTGTGGDEGKSHPILSSAGLFECGRCKNNFCTLCCVRKHEKSKDKEGGNEYLCNDCFKLSSFLEVDGIDLPTAEKLARKGVKSMAKMREELTERGIRDIGSASLFELEGLYDSIIDKEELDMLRKMAKSTVFPLKTPGM